MNKSFLWVLAIVLALPGCFGKKDKKETRKGKKKTAMHVEVDIPVVDEEIKNYFDDDVDEFALLEDNEEDFDAETIADLDLDIDLDALEQASADELDDDFFWVEDVDEPEDSFKNLYFAFDKSDLKEDQEEYVAQNIEYAKELIERGESPTITIEGHSCSSAGSRSYNLAISNNRADVVASRFVADGIPRESIKIVGRGQDVPALDLDGNPIAGDSTQQWPNRRVEIKVYS